MANEPDEVNSGALATIIVLVFAGTLAVALVVTALVRDETNRLMAGGAEAQSRPFENLKNDQLMKLRAAPSWVDREKGIAKVSVDSAKDIVLAGIKINPLALSPGNPPGAELELEKEAEAAESTEGQAIAEGEDKEGAPGAKKQAEKAVVVPVKPPVVAPAPQPVAPVPAPTGPAQ